MPQKDKLSVELAKERTELAEKRTRLAYERTIMADLRTATTIILFGIAFIGLSETINDFFYIAGAVSVVSGILFLFFTVIRAVQHFREIEEITNIFRRLWFLSSSEEDIVEE